MTSTSPHPQFPASSAGPAARGHRLGWLGVAGLVAFVLATLASIVLLFLPVYSTVTTTANGVQTEDTATLWAVNGPWILVPLAFPVLLTAAIALARGRGGLMVSILCTILLAGYTVLALASIGMFYIPALAVSVVAVLGRAIRAGSRP
ncbi:hypothetical protein [Ruania albidiflava]|uniref:hypothetical protein n=1 Tax=Ruania albidiflava TaxID=366586 RepID=UPI0023F0AFF2|nr:hypothetical protein [Ruania albidiflava]